MMRAIVLSLVLAFSLPGCAAVQKVVEALPTVIQYVQDAQFVLDQIDRAAIPILQLRGDEKLSHQYSSAMDKARRALQVALRSAEGGQKLSQQQMDAAFADFKDAYTQLTSLMQNAGLMNSAGVMAARQGEVNVSVEPPLALSRPVSP